jgi:hypothetical protein
MLVFKKVFNTFEIRIFTYIKDGEMTVEELELLGTLSELDVDSLDDDSLASLLEEALEITDDDPYEAITFITENSEIDYEDLQRVYNTFKK